ncbi:MAG: hypothetical protein RRB13_06365 [bacterium]|nr:hypothetical protein [bacterium]
MKTLLLIGGLLLLGLPSAWADDWELGVTSPMRGIYRDSNLDAAQMSGGGVYLKFPTPFLLGVDQFTARNEPSEAVIDPPRLTQTMVNLGFQIPRKEGFDLSLGFGLGSAAVSCDTCADQWESGTTSQLFFKATGGLFGLQWGFGAHRLMGLLRGKDSAGVKVADFRTDATVFSLGIGYAF